MNEAVCVCVCVCGCVCGFLNLLCFSCDRWQLDGVGIQEALTKWRRMVGAPEDKQLHLNVRGPAKESLNPPELKDPKHGKEDEKNEPHVRPNRCQPSWKVHGPVVDLSPLTTRMHACMSMCGGRLEAARGQAALVVPTPRAWVAAVVRTG